MCSWSDAPDIHIIKLFTVDFHFFLTYINISSWKVELKIVFPVGRPIGWSVGHSSSLLSHSLSHSLFCLSLSFSIPFSFTLLHLVYMYVFIYHIIYFHICSTNLLSKQITCSVFNNSMWFIRLLETFVFTNATSFIMDGIKIITSRLSSKSV